MYNFISSSNCVCTVTNFIQKIVYSIIILLHFYYRNTKLYKIKIITTRKGKV